MISEFNNKKNFSFLLKKSIKLKKIISPKDIQKYSWKEIIHLILPNRKFIK
jgi:hypothetical protein